jgi:hypothetical protein
MLKNLGKYTFECAYIYTKSLLKSSLLYGMETCYNMKLYNCRNRRNVFKAII